MKLVCDEAVIYTFDPYDALQDANLREEKERVFVEMLLPPIIYTPPPHDVAEHDVKFNEESVSFLVADDRVTEITPPFSDEQFVNVTPEMD